MHFETFYPLNMCVIFCETEEVGVIVPFLFPSDWDVVSCLLCFLASALKPFQP